MVRFVPVVALACTAVGLLIAGASPAWWIIGLIGVGTALAISAGTTISIGGRPGHLAPYVRAMFTALVAAGLLAAGAAPAWWIAALAAAGLALVVFASANLRAG